MPPLTYPSKVLDSHIHLWPSSAANISSHDWMREVPQLAKQYSVGEYTNVVSRSLNSLQHNADANETRNQRPDLLGSVYVETDRVLTSSFPYNEAEMAWVDGICEDPDNRGLIRGVVLWAPVDKGPDVMRRYLCFVAEKYPAVWRKLVGFRYLLQGIGEPAEFAKLVEDDEFLRGLSVLGEGTRKFTFDVGVSEKVGPWQLEMVAAMIARFDGRDGHFTKVTFVLNHFCKPKISSQSNPEDKSDQEYENWRSEMQRLGRMENVYMKISGLFSELPKQNTGNVGPVAVKSFYNSISFHFSEVIRIFGPKRCMFGSDWPVCNINGPSDDHTWDKWFEVVKVGIEDCGLSKADAEWIWWKTANYSYKLGLNDSVDTGLGKVLT